MLDKLLRLGEGRMVKRLKRVAEYVNSLSEDIEKLTDAELRAKTAEFKKRHADGETLDDLLPECFAVVREMFAAWGCAQAGQSPGRGLLLADLSFPTRCVALAHLWARVSCPEIGRSRIRSRRSGRTSNARWERC